MSITDADLREESSHWESENAKLRERLRWYELWERQVRRFMNTCEDSARPDGHIDRARMEVVTFEAGTPKP